MYGVSGPSLLVESTDSMIATLFVAFLVFSPNQTTREIYHLIAKRTANYAWKSKINTFAEVGI